MFKMRQLRLFFNFLPSFSFSATFSRTKCDPFPLSLSFSILKHFTLSTLCKVCECVYIFTRLYVTHAIIVIVIFVFGDAFHFSCFYSLLNKMQMRLETFSFKFALFFLNFLPPFCCFFDVIVGKRIQFYAFILSAQFLSFLPSFFVNIIISLSRDEFSAVKTMKRKVSQFKILMNTAQRRTY